jgi:hypothetical protein
MMTAGAALHHGFAPDAPSFVTGPAGETRFTLPLAAWKSWTAKDDTPAAFIEPMLRRRLSPLGKASLQIADDCAGGRTPLRVVYISQHGELSRSAEMLTALARDEELSPTSFSLSVLNALPGVYSIHRADPAPSTAVSAGAASLGWGLLEAATQYHNDPAQPVLAVYADAPAPALYAERTRAPAQIAVIGLLFAPDGGTRLTVTYRPAAGEPPSAGAQTEALLECLTRRQPSAWNGDGHHWTWEFHD